jgi:hypothetical protein
VGPERVAQKAGKALSSRPHSAFTPVAHQDSQKQSKEKDEATSLVASESMAGPLLFDIHDINERFESLFASSTDRRRLLEDFDPTQSYYGLQVLAQQK